MTICLNMIVKNEAHVIRRCLESVRPFVDCWEIVDTGSTDGTQALIRDLLQDLPGQLHERPWKNFAHNRNEAMSLAKDKARYVFWLDADETLALPLGYCLPVLDAAAYHLQVEYGGMCYRRGALVRADLPWRWQGVVHEVLTCPEPVAYVLLHGPVIHPRHEGARSRDPETYVKDAALLEEALREDPSNSRYVFYLAQSYRDSGHWARSRDVYERRALMGGWPEEVWYSLYQIAVLSERLADAPAVVSSCYLRAFQARPSRAEPLVQLARYHRLREEYALACLYAKHAVGMAQPTDFLFVESAAYSWRALDEVAASAVLCGDMEAGQAASRRLLTEGGFPPAERVRILRNAALYSRW